MKKKHLKSELKLYKIIAIVLLVIISGLLVSLTASAQSDRKINRLSQEVGLYVRVAKADDELGAYNSRTIYCGEELVTHFINKRHFITHSSKFEFDLDVKKRKVGEYHSWFAVDRNDKEKYYLLTTFAVKGVIGEGGYGVLIQPVTKSYGIRYGEPVVTIANIDICQ